MKIPLPKLKQLIVEEIVGKTGMEQVPLENPKYIYVTALDRLEDYPTITAVPLQLDDPHYSNKMESEAKAIVFWLRNYIPCTLYKLILIELRKHTSFPEGK